MSLFHSWLWNYLYLRLKFSPQLGGFVSIKGWKIHWKLLEFTTIQRWIFPTPQVLQCRDIDLSSIIIASGDFSVILTALPLTKKSFQRIWSIHRKCSNWAYRTRRWTLDPCYHSHKDGKCPVKDSRGNFLSPGAYAELRKSRSRDFVTCQSILTTTCVLYCQWICSTSACSVAL